MGSPATRRRIRQIVDNMVQSSAPGGMTLARTPHVATIAVTYNCQCDCDHCSAVDYQQATHETNAGLQFHELKRAIEETVEMGTTCVVLTGGEPLLYERIYGLISAVDRSKSVCTLFSNGEFLSESVVARLKAAGLYGVFVSFDFPDAARHDANRTRPGLFEKATSGLRRCREAGILTGISTFVTHEKLQNGDMDATMDLARELGVLEVFLFDVIPTGRLDGQRECLLSDAEADQIIEFRRVLRREAGLPARHPPDDVCQHRLSVRCRGLPGGDGAIAPARQRRCLALRLHAPQFRQHTRALPARDLGEHGEERALRRALGALPAVAAGFLGEAGCPGRAGERRQRRKNHGRMKKIASDAAPMIELTDITKTYGIDGKVRALRDLNLRVAAGERVALMGPSGSGKTTVLNLICGLDQPSSGTVKVAGVSLRS